MSTQGALSRARLLPTVLGVLVLVPGVMMLLDGLKLAAPGVSLHDLLVGFGFSATGVLLVLGLRFAVWLFTLMLLLSNVWALWELGLDRQQLMPRLFVWFLLGLLLVLPIVRQGLKPLHRPAPVGGLVMALLLTGVSLEPTVELSSDQFRQWKQHAQGWVDRLVPGQDVRQLSSVDAENRFQRPEG